MTHLGATNAQTPQQQQQQQAPASFGLLQRPDFAAAVASFRESFGQDVWSRTAEGYT
ncbi:hypothetical protein GGF46_004817, partial [Coemansia sp. RSA 552]